jgi:hypothetical protein
METDIVGAYSISEVPSRSERFVSADSVLHQGFMRENTESESC